jgi:hypothetical protein
MEFFERRPESLILPSCRPSFLLSVPSHAQFPLSLPLAVVGPSDGVGKGDLI